MRIGTIAKHTGSVSFATSISRILGYIRDMLIAQVFGAGFAADAFYAAYRIPNLLRRLLGEGALSASYIPVFTEYLTLQKKEETQKFLNAVFTTFFLILTLLTILGIIFAPQITTLFAWGFQVTPDKLELTISLTRIMFPYLLFICLAALLLGTLNSLHVFLIPSLAPANLSIAEIFFVLVVYAYFHPLNPIKGLAVAVLVGGLLQFLFQLPALFKRGWKLRWHFDLTHPGLRRIGLLMLPAMLGFSVEQINAFVDTICASFLREGSITALYYSNRLMQLPLAIFGIAIATVSLPLMSKSATEKNISELKETLSLSLRMMVFIIFPAMIGLMILSVPIIRLLFERGKFNSLATHSTANALFYYSLGLFAYSGVKIVASAFYSLKDTKTPVKIAVLCMSLNVVLNLLLMGPMGVGGLALATAISSIVNLTFLTIFLRKRIGTLGLTRIFKTLQQTVFACLLMGIICYYLAYHIFRDSKFFSVIMPITSGTIVYFFLAYIMKIEESKPLWAFLRREEVSEL